MIKFFDKEGNIYEGGSPYVHWFGGSQSVGLWYSLNIYVLSDQSSLTIVPPSEDSVFKLVKVDNNEDEIDIKELIQTSEYSITSNIHPTELSSWYAFQINIVCQSDKIGQFTDSFTIESGNESLQVSVGADFYEEDETLTINLGNKGLDIPKSIYKAFYESNYHEAFIDNVLINRKFKELVSNFIDVVDCKGSYKSLINSLDWFDWGENTKLYEIWRSGNNLIEKDLEIVLSDIYKDYIFTHSKTTHMALVTSLYNVTDELDSEKNPVIEKISRDWSDEELAIKISILGAFFERYFMPIHLDLKRASVESLVYTNSIKLENGTNYHNYNFLDDNGVVDLVVNGGKGLVIPLGDLNPENEEGNYRPVAVGPDTMFGLQYEESGVEEGIEYYTPIGVDFLDDIDTGSGDYEDNDNDNTLSTFFGQLVGAVGVVIPVDVRVELPNGDGLSMEVLNIKRRDNVVQKIERKYFPAEQENDMSDKYYTHFSFNLLSTEEETVSFTLTLYSLSGHTWTAAATFQTVDVSGSFINVYKIESKGIDELDDEFIENMHGNPWGTQYNTILNTDDPSATYIDPNKYHGQEIIQYLPSSEKSKKYYHELILVENPNTISNSNDDYWEIDRDANHTLYIRKEAGEFDNTITDTLRHEMIFIPQLCNYINLDDHEIKEANYIFTQDDILCVIPQFRQTLEQVIDQNSVIWEFKNMTTLNTINYNIPISKPFIANKTAELLEPGYWSVSMYYRLSGSSELHKLTKNSVFKISKIKDD